MVLELGIATLLRTTLPRSLGVPDFVLIAFDLFVSSDLV